MDTIVCKFGSNYCTERAGLHQASASTLWERCDDACDSVLIENNGVGPEWVATHFQGTPLFSMRPESVASSQNCRNVDADVWCKRVLSYACYMLLLVVLFCKKTLNGSQEAWCACAQWRGLNCNAWLDSITVYHIFVFSKRTLQTKHSFTVHLQKYRLLLEKSLCFIFPHLWLCHSPFHQYIHSDYEEPTEMLFFVFLHGKMTWNSLLSQQETDTKKEFFSFWTLNGIHIVQIQNFRSHSHAQLFFVSYFYILASNKMKIFSGKKYFSFHHFISNSAANETKNGRFRQNENRK